MNSFDRLHPALQHHIVNSLGWPALRPLQQATIEPVLAGEHAILLAPTAGGKTEAAAFPVLSRMLSENWTGLSVLYICPIKALLNNLADRLELYAGLLGRSAALWHGDVRAAAKARVLREPTDILLTTPESIEGMLVSGRVDHRALFRDLQVVIIDEVHAFAGDDRGWHLLYLIERLQRIAGREVQRLGLSATVGNPAELCTWLRQSATAEARVLDPPADAVNEPGVEIDFVGSLRNAAIVISRLHRGEKRLVFCDSRSRVEQLAALLREFEVDTYVSHSSLSLEARTAAEKAFAEGENCVIVATSTLELGVDVGDLDRVIQIDAPPTVAAFLQRIGRAGRREGTRRNCLFLNTSDQAFMRCIGLMQLWAEGYIEPVEPPPLPVHIFAQQTMALALQERGIEKREVFRWLANRPGLVDVGEDDLAKVLEHMLSRGILYEDGGLVTIGDQGEKEFGRRHFSELLAAFTSSPLFAVLHGRSHLGDVHHSTFLARDSGPANLTLGGRSWEVQSIEWSKRVVYVQPSSEKGRSRWLGGRQFQPQEHCQAALRGLHSGAIEALLTDRARAQLSELREAMAWAESESSCVVTTGKEVRWWNFAGALANSALALSLPGATTLSVDDYSIAFVAGVTGEMAVSEIRAAAKMSDHPFDPAAIEEFFEGLKFSACLPEAWVRRTTEARFDVTRAVANILARPIRISVVAPGN